MIHSGGIEGGITGFWQQLMEALGHAILRFLRESFSPDQSVDQSGLLLIGDLTADGKPNNVGRRKGGGGIAAKYNSERLNRVARSPKS